ncbi:MAG: amidase [Actinomycetota bacterium]|nr:amidase [Actinomycetota bacterium]
MSPREALAAIAERDRELNAFVTVCEEAAAADGTPLAVKDLFDTAGVRTTYGSAIFRDHVPEATAEAVRRLETAGYAVVGKTGLHEFAYGITSENEHYGDVRNPLDPGRIPGGSSGGSAAALAARMCDVALGTDSAGSIRIPAACCGVVGFKPTHGAVPTDGVFPLAPGFDTAGPMARTVTECTATLRALGADVSTTAVDLAHIRVGVAWLEHADLDVRLRVERAAALFGASDPIDLPLVPADVYPVFMREAAEVHRELFAANASLYGDNVRTKIERCLRITDAEYEHALAARAHYRDVVAEAVQGKVDLVVTPTIPCVAPPVGIGDLALRERLISLTYPFSVLGWPALALPCGRAELGLPASVQLAAPWHSDSFLLAAGLALERAPASPV